MWGKKPYRMTINTVSYHNKQNQSRFNYESSLYSPNCAGRSIDRDKPLNVNVLELDKQWASERKKTAQQRSRSS